MRATVDDIGQVVSYDDYDPWGMTLAGRSMTAQANLPNKFTGKERDTDFGLDWDYFGARYYDPQIGRWLSVDPLAEKFPSFSPYNYAVNNPNKFIDPDGRGPIIGFFKGLFQSLIKRVVKSKGFKKDVRDNVLQDAALPDDAGEPGEAVVTTIEGSEFRFVKVDSQGRLIYRDENGNLQYLDREQNRFVPLDSPPPNSEKVPEFIPVIPDKTKTESKLSPKPDIVGIGKQLEETEEKPMANDRE